MLNRRLSKVMEQRPKDQKQMKPNEAIDTDISGRLLPSAQGSAPSQRNRKRGAAFAIFLMLAASTYVMIIEKGLRGASLSWTDGNVAQKTATARKVHRNITILMWVPYYRRTIRQNVFSPCAELNCRITHNRSELNRSEAVVFHDQEVHLSDLPKERLSDQHFVFLMKEPPFRLSSANRGLLSSNFYTLTMSYRRDSDVHFPYGYFNARSTPLPSSFWENFKKLVALKTKLAAWFVTNCQTPSAREAYVKQLQRYIPVDIYGKCGSLFCPPYSPLCNETAVLQKYKFYISFENGVCTDYVTEKYFDRLNQFVVPIVFNRKLYESMGPNNSFIAADDFNSSKELADYLKRLDKDDKQYLRYFEWMDMAESFGTTVTTTNGFCNLCRKLQQRKAGEKVTASETAKNVAGWYNRPGTCHDGYGRTVEEPSQRQLRQQKSAQRNTSASAEGS